MRAIPTTTVDVLGGVTTDDLGDEIEGSTVLASGVLASILEQVETNVVTTAADARVQVVRRYTGRLPADTTVAGGGPITSAHRLRDVAGDVYVIDAVSQPAHPLLTNDLHLDLRKRT